MDINVLMTAAGTIVTIVGSNIALISWLRSDMKSFENKIDGWKEQFSRDMESYKQEVHKEMKDFHGRLCSIETKYQKNSLRKKRD